MFPGLFASEAIMQIAGLFLRAMTWVYVQAWPVGLGLIGWSLVSEGAHNQALGLLAGMLSFGVGVVVRFFRRYPSAWPVWKERWHILLTRKKEA